jgi:hypothetical protein
MPMMIAAPGLKTLQLMLKWRVIVRTKDRVDRASEQPYHVELLYGPFVTSEVVKPWAEAHRVYAPNRFFEVLFLTVSFSASARAHGDL